MARGGRQAPCSAGKLQEYGGTLARNVRPHLGVIKLRKLTPLAIQGVSSKMQDAGVTKGVRFVHVLLKNALAQATRWGLIAQHPAAFVDAPRASRTRKVRALSQGEVDAFMRAAERPKGWSLFSLVVGTGLGPSEAIGLLWRDVELGRGP